MPTKYIKPLLLVLTLSSFYACNSSKDPEKENSQENTNASSSTVHTLTREEIILKQYLDTYLREMSAFNTDVIVDMTYPKLFHVIDLDLFRQYIASMMNSTDIQMTSYQPDVTRISKITTFTNETSFAQADYISKIQIRFLNHRLYNTQEKINFLYDALIHKYGAQNINIDLQTRVLHIRKPKKILMIKEKGSEWKFVGDNSKYRQLYPSFLPYEILQHLDKDSNILQSRAKQETIPERKDTNETI